MPDVTQSLEQDHRRVEELFARFEERGDPRIAEQICDELTLHTALEESDVYPRLLEIDPDAAREAKREHDEAKQLIGEIRVASDDALRGLVRKLQAAVDHHVEEEENEIFPEMRERLGSELELMGRRVEQHKHELQGVSRAEPGGRVEGRADVIDLTKLTRDELYARAKEAGISGRSQMTKAQLARALEREHT